VAEAASNSNIELQFVVVYIAEAHAVDEWPVASSRYNFEAEVHVQQTCTVRTRGDAACGFFKRFCYSSDQWKLFVAEPEHECANRSLRGFEAIFKPWPFRAYGFVNEVVDMISEPHACETRIGELRNWLMDNLSLL